MTGPNLAHARAWIERAITDVAFQTYAGYCAPDVRNDVVNACAAALAAAVRAKGEQDNAEVNAMAMAAREGVGYLFPSDIQNLLLHRAADIPRLPRVP